MKTVKFQYIYGLFLFVIPFLTVAQQYSFVHYSVEEGLPQSQVFSLAEDNNGSLWIGTAGGVSRFDGNGFKSYSTNEGLMDNSTRKLLYFNNYLWISTQFGITRIKGKEIVTWDLKQLVSNGGISDFVFDLQNNMWITAKYKGVFKVKCNNNKLELDEIKYFSLDSVNNVSTIFCDNNGIIWVGGKNVFGFFNNDTWHTNSLLNFKKFTITDIKQDTKGNLYIATLKNGLYLLKNRRFTSLLNKSLPSRINQIMPDKNGRIWIASYKGIFLIENGKNVSVFSTKNGLVSNRVRCLFQDSEGNIWAGTDGEGVLRFVSDEMVYYSKKDGLNSNYVMSISEDTSNRILLSTYGGGVSFIENDVITDWKQINNVLPSPTVWTTLYDSSDNSFWIGTTSGLSIVRNNIAQNFINQSWLPSNKVLSLHHGVNQKGKWVGTSRGISFLSDSLNDMVFRFPNSFPAKNVRTIEVTHKKEVWVGTSSGVFILNGSLFTPAYFNSQLKSSIVYSIKAKNEHILIGTANGLYYTQNSDSVKQIELLPLFSSNTINFVGNENDSIWWIGTNYGVFELNLHQYLRNERNYFNRFNTKNGLPSIETNLNAFYKDKFGNVWMGTSKGVVKFTRKKSEKTVTVPSTSITDIRLFLKQTDWSKYSDSINPYSGLPVNVQLNYRKNYLTFYYNAVSLTHSDELYYSVLLKGMDNNWSEPMRQSYITYTNLPYGEYSFMVKSSINKEQWSEPAVFSFVIKKPFYLSTWFLLLSVIAALALSRGVWVWRSKVLKRRALTQKLYYKNKLLALEQQSLNASMNRHFIFNSLNSIQFYINSNDKKSANKYLTDFAKLIRKNLDSSNAGNNLVSLTDEFERLELYLSLEKMRFQGKFNYSIIIKDKSINTDEIMVPPMFLQPFVENSIWHGILHKKNDGIIQVILEKTDLGSLRFIIKDNGIGVERSLSQKGDTPHSSQGVSITAGRLEILKKMNHNDFKIIGPYQLEDDNVVKGTVVEIIINPHYSYVFKTTTY